ncbi:MAG: 16S rRNA processing protein RimM [Magnetococcales bacterium]|nr:16S rRNA processing protein RimM [Magnetococcales bacterium]
MPGEATHWVALGRLKGAFGVRGEVRVLPLTHPIARILPDPGPEEGVDSLWLTEQPVWWLGSKSPPEHEVTLLSGRRHGEELLVRLQGIENREQIQGMAGLKLWLPETCLPDLGSNRHYWFRLIGMRVMVLADEEPSADAPLSESTWEMGVVDSLMATGSNDVLVVREPSGEDRLLPFIRDTILEVNERNQTILVRLMPGL